jgi:phospholipase A-2-activating protein
LEGIRRCCVNHQYLFKCTLDHPGCVWTVAVNPETGDIITGCADGKIRVFTCDASRKAPQDQLDEYDKEVELAAA